MSNNVLALLQLYIKQFSCYALVLLFNQITKITFFLDFRYLKKDQSGGFE